MKLLVSETFDELALSTSDRLAYIPDMSNQDFKRPLIRVAPSRAKSRWDLPSRRAVKALGLEVPATLLARADEVIE